MGLARHGNTRDTNESDIIGAWLDVGASVYQLDLPCDVIVGYRKVNYLFEIKRPLGPRGGSSHKRQTPTQVEFEQGWRGQYAVVRTRREALAGIGVVPPEIQPGDHR